MAIRLSVPEGQLPLLARIRDLGPERLEQLAREVQKVGFVVDPSDLQRPLEETAKQDAAPVVQILLSLSLVARNRDLNPAELVEGVTAGLGALPQELSWNEGQLKAWRSVTPQLIALLSLENVQVLAKAVDLAYEYGFVFDRARIVTDIRPVFGASEDSVKAAIVSQTLRLYYFGENGERTLSVAMEEKDIKQLLTSCQRALLKARAAKGLMEEKCKLPVRIAGEADDEPA